MRLHRGVVLCLTIWAAWAAWDNQAAAADLARSEGELVEETWEAGQVDGVKVGFIHTTVRALPHEGGKVLRTVVELDLTFRRQGALVRVRMENGTEETVAGKVVAVSMRQPQDRGRQLVLEGALEDDVMHVKIDGGRIDRRLPWSDDVVGLYRQHHLFQKREPKTGDRISFQSFEPTLDAVATWHAEVIGREIRELAAGRRSLLRVDLKADALEAPGIRVQLPSRTLWLDAEFLPVCRELELEGLGPLFLTRTTRAIAMAPTPPGRQPDIGRKTLTPLGNRLENPYGARAAIYRVTVQGDLDPETALISDAHQECKNFRGKTFEVHVHPVRYGEGPTVPRPDSTYLASCHFIDSDDTRVREIAHLAVAGESDAWRKARRLERWVKENMRIDNAAALMPASGVARSLRGDCRQAALLTAALCRAEEIPSRTAVGLLYVEKGGRPYLGFHLWTEVWVEGRWLGLDGTLGLGGVGAGHLKIADHSWYDTPSLTPLLPAARVLGKIAVEVIRVGQ